MHNHVRSLSIALISLVLGAALLHAQTPRSLKSSTTAHFRISFDKYVSESRLKIVENDLERSYALFKNRLKFAPGGRVPVYLYSSRQQPRAAVFNDAWYDDGKIVILSGPLFENEPARESVVNRVVADAFAHSVVTCPPWVAETYALAMGEDFGRFGMPTRVTVATFTDLGEDLARADGPEEQKMSYANLAGTARFFNDNYGAAKLDGVLTALRAGKMVDEAFSSALGVKFGELERTWAEYLHGLVKK